MLAVAYLSPGVVFPVIFGGGLILTLLLSVAIFKEKLNRYRIIGFVIGVISIVPMNAVSYTHLTPDERIKALRILNIVIPTENVGVIRRFRQSR